jgi:hypothetical protein
MLHLICSGVANFGNFPFWTALLQGKHIFSPENLVLVVVKSRYSFCKSSVRHLMLCEKCNCLQIAHVFLGVSCSFFRYVSHEAFFVTWTCIVDVLSIACLCSREI